MCATKLSIHFFDFPNEISRIWPREKRHFSTRTPTHDRKNRVFAASNKRHFTRKPPKLIAASSRPHSALLNAHFVLTTKIPGTHLILTRENALFHFHPFSFFRNLDPKIGPRTPTPNLDPNHPTSQPPHRNPDPPFC